MKKYLAGLTLVVSVILMGSCQTGKNPVTEQPQKKPLNIIFLIGDGMGLSQVTSAFYFKDSKPNFARFKHIGLMRTSSALQKITDSAAGATAFASGVKTYNGAIGVDTDTSSVETIIEIASKDDIQTGLVVTSSITHATPACFYAHVPNRGQAEDIAVDLVNSGVDYFAGGGLQFFAHRHDDVNLLDKLEEKGFRMDTTSLDDAIDINQFNKLGYLLAPDGMKPVAEGRDPAYLSKATSFGTKFLSKDNKNFFMMVEGSQIDWGGHANNTNYLITELIDFDNAIGAALDFAEKDGNTLVVVTADHETGGFTLSSTHKKTEDGREYDDYNEITPTFSTGGHSATLIPVFAYGPGAEDFEGIYENTEIFNKMLALTGWNTNK